MRRLLWMDRLRGAAIVAVVVLHAELQAVSATGGALPVVHEANALLAPVRMPLLVVLSGMLLTPALARPPRRYLAGKARHLLWPYLVWSAVDLAHLQLRLMPGGDSLSAPWVLRVVHDPPTYLWFLAYLLVFYVVSLALPPAPRTVAGPAMIALALLVPGATLPADRLVWLLGWFLVGDTVGRLLRGRLRPGVASSRDLLGHVGRHSLVYYCSHLTVAILVTDRLAAAGVSDPWAIFAACVVVPLLAGLALARARRYRAVDALFAWPARGRCPGVSGEDERQPPHGRREHCGAGEPHGAPGRGGGDP